MLKKNGGGGGGGAELVSSRKVKSSPKSVAVKFCSKRLKKEFETAMVNEPSSFEPFKFYCSMFSVTSVDQKCNTYTILHQFLCLVTSPVAKIYLFFYFICDID